MIETNRRTLITGLIALVATPAIVRAGSLMPLRGELLEPDDGMTVGGITLNAGDSIVFTCWGKPGKVTYRVNNGLLQRLPLPVGETKFVAQAATYFGTPVEVAVF